MSWYEAAAYAEFAGKSLPTITQWYNVDPADLAVSASVESNFSGHGPWRVGTSPDVGPFGTYDMSGNVREWVSIRRGRSTVYFRRRVANSTLLGLGSGGPSSFRPFRAKWLSLRTEQRPLPGERDSPMVGYARDFAKCEAGIGPGLSGLQDDVRLRPHTTECPKRRRRGEHRGLDQGKNHHRRGLRKRTSSPLSFLAEERSPAVSDRFVLPKRPRVLQHDRAGIWAICNLSITSSRAAGRYYTRFTRDV